MDFADIQQEMLSRLNKEQELVPGEEEPRLQADSPLAIVNGNFFQVMG